MGAGFGSAYNQNAQASATYLWNDANRNGDYDPGEVDLDLNGPDFVSVSGASNNILNPDLKQPMTTEVTASIERELRQNLGVHGIYVFKREGNNSRRINALRPLSAYDIPIVRTDPGPDGALGTVDDGGQVTLYDYEPSYFGGEFVGNEYQNSPNPDSYQSIEAGVNKRTSERWGLIASFGATKSHRWIASPASTPAELAFPVDNTWSWNGTFSGSYRLPYEMELGAMWQTQSGVPGQRTYVFRRSDASGPSLKQLASIKMPLGEFGAERAGVINTVNLRVTKEISLARNGRLALEFNAYNLFNSNSPAVVNYASGPTYGYVTAIMAPRIVRFGAKYTF
jgi:hypothetical protein